jgi:hypothetical protein
VLGYRGEMTDTHLRAAIRIALAARGLEFDHDRSSADSAEQWSNGVALRDKILASSVGSGFWCLQQFMPEMWDRAPLVLDLGFRQTSLFQTLIAEKTDFAGEAAVLGAAFNLAITCIDYFADELGVADRLFNLLDASLIRNIFVAPSLAAGQLASQTRQSEDGRERFLLGLVAFCASSGCRLLQATRNQAAWEDLGRVIAQLLESEREVARSVWPSHSDARRLLPYVEAKSCLPSVASLHVARLAYPPGAIVSGRDLLRIARRVGTMFWRIDDLVDVLRDLRAGTPNGVLIGLADRLAAEGRPFASDKDIYDEVDRNAQELAELVDFNSGIEPVEVAHTVAQRDGLLRFAESVITGWTSPPGGGESFRRAAAPKSKDGADVCVALTFLLSQQANGYQEAIHHLHFPRMLDEGVRYETQPSLLSHRAVILDALLDAAEAGLDCPSRVLAAECVAILRSKHRDVRGGWSYIQEAPELPPDADDLGQVLQVLTRFGGHDLASICEEAIRLLLDSSEEDGSFCTWILDPDGNSFAHERMRSYLSVMGGWGIHPEVVANLLYGLCLYDPTRYRAPLHRSVTYLERVQSANGSWSSKWYTGPFYGTWRAVSVLSRLTPASKTLARARGFLLAGRNPDGGWGEGSSEPLSTALALLSLCLDGVQPDAAVLLAASTYLSRTQRSDGGWVSCPWIFFPTVDGPVEHGSASVTTAFCLKALLTARHLLGQQFEPVRQGVGHPGG